MNQVLPSDRLKNGRRLPWIVGGAAAIAIAASAVMFGPTVASQLNPAADPTPTPTLTPYVATLTQDDLDTVQQSADLQAAHIASDKAAAEAAAAAERAAALSAAHQQQSGGGPVKCAPGYKANAVDGDGNESNCQKNGPGNRPCVAYNDQNQCTAWLEG